MGIRHALCSLILFVGLCLEANGQFTNAASEIPGHELLSTSNSSPTGDAERLLADGISFYQDRDFKAAVDTLKKAVLLEPTNYEANLYLGYNYYYLTQFDAATVAFRAAIQCQPTDPDSHYWLGSSLYALNRFDESVTVLKQTLDMDPGRSEAWFVLGSCQYYQEAYQFAAESFQKAARTDPSNYLAQIWTGYSSVRANRFDAAAAAFQQAISLQPQDYDANLWRAISLLRLWDFKSAIPNLEQALKSKPRDPDASELLLACYFLTGQLEKVGSLHLSGLFGLSIFLVLSYLPLTGFLLVKSLRPGLKPGPGFGFASLWWGAFMLGESVLIFAPLVLFSWTTRQAFGIGSILSATPVIIAALAGFVRQPWGRPFAWPPAVFHWKLLLISFASLCACGAFSWIYVELLELIRGKPIPPQLILEWLGTDARKWPLSVLVGVVLVGPITEEILFRGLIYGALNRRFSTAWTIISTAALFSLGHFDINYFVPIFAIGLALGWARNKSESVWVPSLMHCSYNAANFIAMLLFQIGDRR